MAANTFLYIALCVLVSASSLYALQTVDGKIKITIGTTAGCSDTVTFISNQLAEAYETYSDFLEVEFVPWGRTERHDNDSLTCQFGPNDCWANRLHRCALDLLNGNQDAQVHYMLCEFSSPHPGFLQGSYLCAQAVGLSLVDVDYCVTTSGRHLDDAAELAAREPMAEINFVPSIHFHDDLDTYTHNQARNRLSSIICFALAADADSGITACQI